MVGTELSAERIREGARLIEALDRTGVGPTAALWLYSSETGWRLLLAEKSVASEGPRQAYRSVQKTLGAARNEIHHLSLSDISMTTPDMPIFRSLRRAVPSGHERAGIRFVGAVVDGMLIEDAYVYRLLPHRHRAA